MGKLIVVDHPLVAHKINRCRIKKTSNVEFRLLVEEISYLLFYEASRDLETVEKEIETPICKSSGRFLEEKQFVLVPILRAGLGLLEGGLRLLPNARVGHIGLYRNEKTHKPVPYYTKLPANLSSQQIFLLDPMLATGGSAVAAVSYLKDSGARQIKYLGLIAAPEGVKLLQESHPDVDIYIASLDDGLDSNAFIIPGLGDAGDRLFGTDN